MHLLCLIGRKSKCSRCNLSLCIYINCNFLSHSCTRLRSIGPIEMVNSGGYILCGKSNSDRRIIEAQALTKFLDKVQFGELNLQISRVHGVYLYINCNSISNTSSCFILQIYVTNISTLVAKFRCSFKAITCFLCNCIAINRCNGCFCLIPIVCTIYSRQVIGIGRCCFKRNDYFVRNLISTVSSCSCFLCSNNDFVISTANIFNQLVDIGYSKLSTCRINSNTLNIIDAIGYITGNPYTLLGCLLRRNCGACSNHEILLSFGKFNVLSVGRNSTGHIQIIFNYALVIVIVSREFSNNSNCARMIYSKSTISGDFSNIFISNNFVSNCSIC